MAFDPYTVLGLPRTAKADEIRRAYRQLARVYHPDVNSGPEAEERFKELAQAFSILGDPRRRSLFDEFGDESLHLHFDLERARARQARPAVDGGPHPQPRSGDRERRPAAGPAPTPVAPDLVVPLSIDLGQAVRGGTLHVSVPHGRAALAVTLPAGVTHGERLRLPGRGQPGARGSRPGDLVVLVQVRDHPYFQRSGDDLHLTLPITVNEAVRGASIEIPSPTGRLRLHVPPLCRGGERVCLKGKGIHRQGATAGDLWVQFSVRLPERMQAALRQLDQLAGLYDAPVRRDLTL